MKTLFKLISGFVADQNGNGSRKAMTLYVDLYFLYILIKASIDGKQVNEYILGVVVVIALFCLGAITTEWITKNYNPDGKPTNTPPTP